MLGYRIQGLFSYAYNVGFHTHTHTRTCVDLLPLDAVVDHEFLANKPADIRFWYVRQCTYIARACIHTSIQT